MSNVNICIVIFWQCTTTGLFSLQQIHMVICVYRQQLLFFQSVCSSRLTESWHGAHQIGGEEGLEVEEQPSAGDLLQPTTAGFLGLLKVLWVRAVLLRLPAYIVELRVDTKKLRSEPSNTIKQANRKEIFSAFNF